MSWRSGDFSCIILGVFLFASGTLTFIFPEVNYITKENVFAQVGRHAYYQRSIIIPKTLSIGAGLTGSGLLLHSLKIRKRGGYR